MKTRRPGFTLLEIMIAVVIIGILAATAIPMYSSYVKKSRVAEAKTVLGDIRQMQLMIKSGRNEYAADITETRWRLNDGPAPYMGKGPAFYTYNTSVKGSTARTPHGDTVPQDYDDFGLTHDGTYTTDGASLR